MKVDWSPLTRELSVWRLNGLSLPLWWRDDDAVADTPELARLSVLSGDVGVPVCVAVIPDLIQPTLAPMIAQHHNLIPIIHGWRHLSHAPAGAKNAEFGHPRMDAEGELSQAYEKMQAEFGSALVPLFVPPWNRIAHQFLPTLAMAGYQGLSTYGPRKTVHATQGVVQVNTHVDPIFWRGDRGLVDPESLVADLVTTLQERRMEQTDRDEPLGLLTHHLVHTEDVWAFTRDVIAVLLDGGAIPADIGAVLQAGRSPSI